MGNRKDKDKITSFEADISATGEELIDSILEEAKYLTEQEEMEKAAEKYREKAEDVEIFSNTSKEPRLTNVNPLDVTTNIPKLAEDQTDLTMRAEILMDTMEEFQEPEPGPLTKTEEPREPEKVVLLTPEYDENTVIADDVVENAQALDIEGIQSIDSIDIELPDTDTYDTEPQEFDETRTLDDFKGNVDEHDKNQSNYEKLFGKPTPISAEAQTVVSKVPVYRHESKTEKIMVKAGKFSEMLRSEYEEYVKSKDPVISQTHIPSAAEKNTEEGEKAVKGLNERFVNAVTDFFANEGDEEEEAPLEEKAVTVEDYESPQDAKSILFELNTNIRKLFIRGIVMTVVTLLSVALTVLQSTIPQQINQAVPAAPVLYCLFQFLLVCVTVFANGVTISNGLMPLIRFKGNSDTALAVAAVGAVLQCAVSLFMADSFLIGNLNLFSVIAILGFWSNTWGKFSIVRRVKSNFSFITDKSEKYAAKIYTNEQIAAKMMSGTVVGKPIIAYQHKSGFLTNFLKISYAPDPTEDISSRVAPITTVCAIVISIIYGVLFQDVVQAFTVFALITAVSIPVCSLLAANIPMKRLSKKLLRQQAMLAGYPSIKQFSSCEAVMVNANDLYPKGSVVLNGIKTFISHKVDESILISAAVLQEADSPLSYIFLNLLEEDKKSIPKVESVMYEDNMGLVGWVRGERILIGSRQLLKKYGVKAPSLDYEEKYTKNSRQVTYFAQAGQLVAMFVTTYQANIKIAQELQRAQNSGISILVRTTDYNITNDKIADDFGVFYRSVKVLPTGLGNVCKEAFAQKEDRSRAYLATKGSFLSLLRSLAACVQIKSNIMLAVVIQLIAIILGFLLAASISLYSGVESINIIAFLLYTVFWMAAVIIAPAIKKP